MFKCDLLQDIIILTSQKFPPDIPTSILFFKFPFSALIRLNFPILSQCVIYDDQPSITCLLIRNKLPFILKNESLMNGVAHFHFLYYFSNDHPSTSKLKDYFNSYHKTHLFRSSASHIIARKSLKPETVAAIEFVVIMLSIATQASREQWSRPTKIKHFDCQLRQFDLKSIFISWWWCPSKVKLTCTGSYEGPNLW